MIITKRRTRRQEIIKVKERILNRSADKKTEQRI